MTKSPAASFVLTGLLSLAASTAAAEAAGRGLPARLELAAERLTIRTQVAGARWPAAADSIFEAARLLASDGEEMDQFGWSVAVSGRTVVVGARNDDQSTGSAYVFTEPAGGWSGTPEESAKLVASDGAPLYDFGYAVTVSGHTVVVGAYDNIDNAIASGAAYVFTRPPGGWSGTLTEDAKLLASDRTNNDEFGWSVSIHGGTIAVGAWGQDTNTGAAYVFVEPGGGWSGTLNEAAKLVASDGAGGDGFGESIAVSGDAVVVGAWLDDDNGSGSGSAYVFTRPGGGWSGTLNENAKLLASDGAGNDQFAWSVAVDGGTVAVSSHLADVGTADEGAVYVFTEPAGGWSGTLTENAKLLASDRDLGDQFGHSVAVSGTTLIAGANASDNGAHNTGSAYLFTEPAGGWTGTLTEDGELLASDAEADDLVGHSVAVSGSIVLAGAPSKDVPTFDEGAAYVFVVLETIFTDGFESGDTSAWSASVP